MFLKKVLIFVKKQEQGREPHLVPLCSLSSSYLKHAEAMAASALSGLRDMSTEIERQQFDSNLTLIQSVGTSHWIG